MLNRVEEVLNKIQGYSAVQDKGDLRRGSGILSDRRNDGDSIVEAAVSKDPV
jgi:hypothetical protein